MSLPRFPDKDQIPTREEVINQIISSIAMEELGLSHIINTEGEKLQYAMGTIEGIPGPKEPLTTEELIALNESIHKTLNGTMMNQFMLKEKLLSALTASVMQGPPGQTGAVGTILDSYDTLDELREKHPTGKQGDAYLVGGKLYVWKEGATDWELVGDLTGPPGTGTTIKGEGESKDQLDKDYPDGPPEDAYVVDGEIYIWNEADGWHSAGSIRGPVGTLIKGTYTSLRDLQREHPDGPPEDAYLIDGQLYVWDKDKGWHSVGDLRGPEGASYTIIPFASAEAPFTYSNNGDPSRVSLLGFGYGDRRGDGLPGAADYSIVIDPSNHAFSLTSRAGNANKQLAFSLPFNMILKSIHITVGNYGQFNPTGEVIPYIQLFKAEKGTNSFFPIAGASAIPETGIGPGNNISADTMLYASNDTLNIPLEAGTRIAIGAMMRIRNDTWRGQQTYWLYFTGGIGFVYNPNPTP